MRYLPFFFRLSLIALLINTASTTLAAKDPAEEAEKWATEAKSQLEQAKAAALKVDCEKPKSADNKALAKAIDAAREAAAKAQTWVETAKEEAKKAAEAADRNPRSERAKEAKKEADEAVTETEKAANEAKEAYESALEESPGMKAAAEIGAELDKANTDGNSKKPDIVDRLKKKANDTAVTNHCDPDEVKRVVRVELEKIKKEVARNQEMKPWVDDLEKKLKDNDLIYFPIPDADDETEFTATSTNNTTGHIADMVAFNPTGKPVWVALHPMFIPSDGTFQYYVTIGVGPVRVPAHGTVNIKIMGNCANIFAPAVPAGEPMPPVNTWISVDNPSATESLPSGIVYPPTTVVANPGTDWKPNMADGWVPADTQAGAITATIPGTETPLGYTIDPVAHPTAAAPILLNMLDQINQTYDQQQAEGLVTTPFSGNPEKQRETVVQHSFWISSAALTGGEYKVKDFEENTVKEFQAATGLDYNTLPEAEKEQLGQGIVAFWISFEGVGTAAKVIQKQEG